MKSRLKRILLCVIYLGGSWLYAQQATLPAVPVEKRWYDQVNFSGFVDVYFNYLSNNKMGNQQDTTGTFNTYNKQFAINAVELDAEKLATKDSPWGFRMDIQNGQNLMYQERPYSTSNSIYNMQLLQQAYVSFYFPFLKGTILDIGKMSTHIGNEVLESKDNWNYTIGHIFFNTIPFIHTGARMTSTFSDKWSGALLLYNSAQGTGFFNPYSAYRPGYDNSTTGANPVGVDPLKQGSFHSYNDSMNHANSVGTQLRGTVLNDKLDIVWNTLYGNDNPAGRIPNSEWLAMQAAGLDPKTLQYPASNNKYDYWFINHLMMTFHISEKFDLRLDWTFGEKSGAAAQNQGAYVKDGTTTNVDGSTYMMNLPNGSSQPISMFRDGNKVKRIYNTYGIFAKYQFTDKFTLGFRYENIDDSRYGGPLVVNAPLYGVAPYDRQDLIYLQGIGQKASANLGQARTLTFTPTYIWSENIIIKVDLRRDWALGNQFVDTHGKPTHYQNGMIVGIVAKF